MKFKFHKCIGFDRQASGCAGDCCEKPCRQNVEGAYYSSPIIRFSTVEDDKFESEEKLGVALRESFTKGMIRSFV